MQHPVDELPSEPPASRYHVGKAHYFGDMRHMVGEVKGHTTYQIHVLATDASYDPATDITTVTFTTLSRDDIANRYLDQDRHSMAVRGVS